MKRSLWAAEWHSKNKLDGEQRYLIYRLGVVELFPTKKACEEFIRSHYGNIAYRQDVRREPHGWRMPKAVRVNVVKVSDNQ